MSANYSPWETSNFAGSSLEGTMAVDRASGPSIADVMEQPPPPGEPPQQASPFADQLSLLGQFGQQMAQSQQPPEAAIQNITFNAKTGMAKLEMPQSALAEVMGQLTDLKTMKAAAMAQVAKYRQQEASGSPILDALSQFAGGMAANDPTMPGWVQALGRTSLSMGNQGIEKKRMLEENRVLQLGQSIAEMQQVAVANERAERQMALQEGRLTAEQKDKELGRLQATIKDVGARYQDEVNKGRPIDPVLIATELAAGNVAPERAIAIARQMEEQSKANAQAAQDAKTADIKDKRDLERFKSGLDLNKSLTVEARQHAYKMAELGFNRETDIAKATAAAATKDSGERKLPGKARETLVQINALDEKLDNLVERAKEFEGTMGPIAGRLGSAREYVTPSSEFSSKRKAIRSELQRFVAQYVKAVQGGGNTISNKDVENAAKSLPNMNVSYEQFVALIKSIKEEGQYQRDVMRAAYEADWEGKDKPLLGAAPKPAPASPGKYPWEK